MNISETLKQKVVRIRINQKDALFMGVIFVFIVMLGALAIDGYVFYDTILSPREAVSFKKQLSFPEKETENLMNVLDARQRQFLTILGE